MNWFVYIVKCSDGSLYTGITTDIARRIKEHNGNNLKGSKFTRSKRPVTLEYYEKFISQSDARKREAAIKNWKREYKLKFILKNKLKGFTL